MLLLAKMVTVVPPAARCVPSVSAARKAALVVAPAAPGLVTPS
jgi:hypothetical protein